jgi:hypothetical protein
VTTHTIILKPAIFALLASNAVIYATAGRASEGIDALAWFALLLLFEIENRYPRRTRITRNAVALDLLRLIAAAGIAISALAFVREGEWLDALNAWLWIGVVAVLELEVRAPLFAARHRRPAAVLSVTLYGALGAVASAWFAQGEWFDGYDAVLWIAAFALIEMDLLKTAASARGIPGKII